MKVYKDKTVTVHRCFEPVKTKVITAEHQKETDKKVGQPLTNKQKKVRARNKIARKSRQINR